uniref:KOW domain-containing protein n=1 Tax=Arundo donax TaxID=35708 RepID=A0A0A9FQK4_ARUDO
MDVLSPVIGGQAEGNWLLPDVLVSVSRGGDDVTNGVVKEVLTDGSCLVALGSGSGDEVIAAPNELEVVRPKKNERLKIMNGCMRGLTGKLIGVDGSDGIVRVEGSLDVKIVDMVILGKMAA